MREKYLEFLRKVEEAELAETLESAQQGEGSRNHGIEVERFLQDLDFFPAVDDFSSSPAALTKASGNSRRGTARAGSNSAKT